ncbi:MAG: galactokinase [Austwickia sp.]|nr:galactokinase [Austwickia sp.]
MGDQQPRHRNGSGVALAYRERYGEDPAGCWRAPGRVNLIGEHTDYTGGLVLPLAIDHACYVAAGPAPGTRTTVGTLWGGDDGPPPPVSFEAGHIVPGDLTGWAAYVAGVVWALRERLGDVPGPPALNLLIDSEVPVGAGLSSSAALECAVAVAVTALVRDVDPEGPARDLTPLDLALVAKRCENDFVGAPTGYMDQLASMLGRPGHLLYLDTRSLTWEHVPFDPAAGGLQLLVIDTRAPHALVDGEYAVRRATCEQATRMLGVGALRDIGVADLVGVLARLPQEMMRRRVRHVVTENERVRAVVALLRAQRDLRALGPLLNASHDSLRDDFEVTVPHLDVAVDAARSAGAVGARMTGGGFGGSVIALVDADRSEAVATAVREAFAGRGFAPPAVFPVSPGAGAGRLS